MVGVLIPHTISFSSVSNLSDTRKQLPTEALPHYRPQITSCNSAKTAEISKNPYVWNTRIRTRIENSQHKEALLQYLSMVKESVPPDEFTFPLVIKACSALKKIREGKQIHTRVLKEGFLVSQDVFVQNSLLYMYANCGFLEVARRLFDEMTERTLVSWNSMIAGYSKSTGLELEAVLLYVLMLNGGILPDGFSFTVLFRACASALAVKEAIQIHSHVIKLGFESNPLINNSLIDMYVKFGSVDAAISLFSRTNERASVSWNALITGLIRKGDLDSAEALFDKMDVRNVVSWNTMISGYVQNGLCNDALDLFRRMQLEGTNPNSITIVSVLSACSVAGSLSLGKWVHLYSETQGLVGSNEIVKAALVNMYSKCGDIESARRIFESMVKKDVVSWDVMIEGFALNGQGEEALELFHKMIREGVKPDEITFIGLLNACRHAGLVEEGLNQFRKMRVEFGIEPNLEHYACVVDLLGRAGRLSDALKVIEGMTIAPDAVVWSALLGACRKHNDMLLAESVVSRIMELDPKCSSNYVIMSNIYAAQNQWEEVATMRRMMKIKETEKEPGCSLIEIGGIVNKFSAGGSSHPLCRVVFQKLEELMNRIKMKGYVPDTDFSLRNIRQEEKERDLYYHSEKLAVAFGIMNTPPGTQIRIVNNLRICKDCHSAMNLIAQIEGRQIIVRDRNRFHHFKDGRCSCGNYW
ncbi:Pentatricopeptide repeat [Macleaya cordata]|uniref:Pentatricopeptide repeat n=1 Tax=Macleaya cordata TaxID=56857 RepID=A0A200Q9K2_MACCD|nr:Pentatricopeptide repeat [Macleaya cordata]